MKKIILTTVATMMLASTAFAGPKAPKKTDALLKKGKEVFTTAGCTACHGEKGIGDGPAAVALNPKPRNFAKDKFKNGEKPAQVFKTITEGLAGTPMVAYGHLPEEDRWALAYHVLSFKKAKKGKKK